MPGQIINNQISGGKLINLSNIGINLPKLQSMPQGWAEVDGYRETVRGNNETMATRVFQGPWGTRLQFYEWVLGYSTNTPVPLVAPTNGQLSRYIPAQHPEMPHLYAHDIELVQGQGAITNNPNVFAVDNLGNPVFDAAGNPIPVPMIAYIDMGGTGDRYTCRVAIHYRVLPYEVRTDQEVLALANTKGELERYVSRQKKYALRAQTLVGQLKFYEGPSPDFPSPNTIKGSFIPDNAGQKIYPLQELHYTWHNVPDIPEQAIQNCYGCVNSDVFDGAQGQPSYAPGTLLFQPPDTPIRERNVAGRVTWTLTYRFIWNPVRSSVSDAIGWNVFPAADGGNYGASFGGASNGPKMYPSAQFAQLFTQPVPVAYQ